MRKAIISLFLLFVISFVYGQETQQNIDSLVTALKSAAKDTSKVRLFQKIAGHYNVTHLDSARPFAESALSLSKELAFDAGEWMSYNVLGNYFERKTDYDNAMFNYNAALTIVERLNSTKGFAVVLNNIATIHIRKGEYQKAIDLMFEALKAEESLNNRNGVAQAYNNIGICYYYMQNFEKTTFYLTTALEIQEELGNFDGLINGYNNVGAILNYQKKYKEAIVSYEKGLAISKKIGDKKLEAVQLNNIALAYTKLKDFVKSEELFESSLSKREEIEDYNGMCQTLISYGELWLDQKNAKRAEGYLLRGKDLAEKYDLKQKKVEAYAAMAKWHALKGNYDSFESMYKLSNTVKDTVVNEQNSKAILEIETKYETEKKEKEILLQRAQIAEQELEVKKKNTMIYGSLGFALLLGLLGYLFYNQQRLKNRQLKKEGELKTALARIETQNKLQEQRLRISRDLHDNIGAQLTFIISSLDNLKYGFKDMGDALGNKVAGISSFTGQTIYELRDTIWAMNKNSITFEDLQVRISNFIEKAKGASASTNFNFFIASEVDTDYVFTSVEGMNIYRIIQEAVNNALKYAEANEVKVHISEEKNGFTMRIADNGIGFTTTTVSEGNGLNNMKKRAKEIQAEFTIESETNKGTSVALRVPKKE